MSTVEAAAEAVKAAYRSMSEAHKDWEDAGKRVSELYTRLNDSENAYQEARKHLLALAVEGEIAQP